MHNPNDNFIYRFFRDKISENQCISYFFPSHYDVCIKREDELHPFISGNKLRKLKYNLIEACRQKHTTILTFGGAFSNHITATAYAGMIFNFKTIGVIRGDELAKKEKINPTLVFAKKCGMHLDFISREEYKKKGNANFIVALQRKYGNFYLIPEGANNTFGVKGCQEILSDSDKQFFDYICCPVGTGATLAGIVKSRGRGQQVLGFSALKNPSVVVNISSCLLEWECFFDTYFGGYGKVNEVLVEFINMFRQKTHVLLDPIYTAKMVYKITKLMEKGYFNPNKQRILIIHTGGLQGISGVNALLKKKQLRTIDV